MTGDENSVKCTRHNDVSVNGVAAGLQLHGQLLVLKRRVLRACLLKAGVGGLRGAGVGVGVWVCECVCVCRGCYCSRLETVKVCACVCAQGADERMINVHYYYYYYY